MPLLLVRYRMVFASFYQYVRIACLVLWVLLLVSVSPGNIWTPLWDQLAQGTGNFEKSKRDGEESQVSDKKLSLFLSCELRCKHASKQNKTNYTIISGKLCFGQTYMKSDGCYNNVTNYGYRLGLKYQNFHRDWRYSYWSSIYQAVYCLSLQLFLLRISSRSYVGSVYRMRSLAVYSLSDTG